MPRRKKGSDSASRGLAAPETAAGDRPEAVRELERQVEADGGAVLGAYRDPLGGHWQLLAALPIDKVSPTPFQRDLSDPHVGRLTRVLDSLDRFLDPIITVRGEAGGYWTPNGNHRLSAMRRLGGRSIVALVLPEPALAYKILALNTERAHNLREKALEVIRMARDLAPRDPRPEVDFAVEFEEPAFLTLGVCYEKNGRFAGGAYHPILKRVDAFLADPLPAALEEREARARKVLELEEAVAAAMAALQEKGFASPYLRPFVVARVNPLRFHKGAAPDFDTTLEKMIASARKFKPDSVKADQVARAGGAAEE
jgi:ParB family chromosome partitioning protein